MASTRLLLRPCARTFAALLALMMVAGAGPFSQSELVIHKEGTKLYHRPGCPVVRGTADVLALNRAQAEARGYNPHPDCDPANPAAVPEVRAPERGGRGAAPAPSEIVYIGGPKYYHRKDCRRLKSISSPKSMTLAAAIKTHWPCPACKAPILKRNTEPAIPGTNRRRGG